MPTLTLATATNAEALERPMHPHPRLGRGHAEIHVRSALRPEQHDQSAGRQSAGDADFNAAPDILLPDVAVGRLRRLLRGRGGYSAAFVASRNQRERPEQSGGRTAGNEGCTSPSAPGREGALSEVALARWLRCWILLHLALPERQ